MKRFNAQETALSGLYIIERDRLGDHRGYLSRLFCADFLKDIGWNKPIAQLNHTYTAQRGTVRGLHYQCAPFSEAKLVTCLRGEIWDIAVDLRRGSPTFLQWHSEILSESNNKSLLIPEGFAHGFQSLTGDVELVYCHSNSYNADSERGLNIQDPLLDINWPLAIEQISERDRSHPWLDDTFSGVL